MGVTPNSYNNKEAAMDAIKKKIQATNKLDKAATAADDSDRMRKVLENRAVQDEERMSKLEEELKMPGTRLRRLTSSTMRLPRDCSRLRVSLRRLRRGRPATRSRSSPSLLS